MPSQVRGRRRGAAALTIAHPLAITPLTPRRGERSSGRRGQALPLAIAPRRGEALEISAAAWSAAAATPTRSLAAAFSSAAACSTAACSAAVHRPARLDARVEQLPLRDQIAAVEIAASLLWWVKGDGRGEAIGVGWGGWGEGVAASGGLLPPGNVSWGDGGGYRGCGRRRVHCGGGKARPSGCRKGGSGAAGVAALLLRSSAFHIRQIGEHSAGWQGGLPQSS